MLAYVYGYDELVADFVAKLIPHCRRGFVNCKAIGVIDQDGKLIAGMVYHNWDPDTAIIEMSGAALTPHWLTRETLGRIYRYPFLGLNCQMVVMRVPADNERLLSILARYNYALIKFPRLFGRERDGVICYLTREAWDSNVFNQRLQHHIDGVNGAALVKEVA